MISQRGDGRRQEKGLCVKTRGKRRVVNDEAKKGFIQSAILAERITLTQDSGHGKTNQATNGQSTNKAETRDGSGNIDVFPPALESRIMFDRCRGNHAKCRDIPIRPAEGKEN